MKSIRYEIKSALLGLPLRAIDGWRNRKCYGSRSLLIARHSGKRAYTYRDFWQWVETNLPELRKHIRFERLPVHNVQWNRIGLHTCWIADTLDVWSPKGYRNALALAQQCRQQNIPIINPIDSVAAATKSNVSEIWRSSGLRAPHCHLIHDRRSFLEHHAGLSFPFLVRDNRGHGRPSTVIERQQDLNRIEWNELVAPMAAEFIDTRSTEDGLYRKYRCIVAGDRAIPRHLIANRVWEVRPEGRVISNALRDEELEFVSNPVPHEDQLVYACRVLGLDWMGVDYSVDSEGEIVLWEANPVANLNAPPADRAGHIRPAVDRSFAALAKLYMVRLNLKIPSLVCESLDELPRASHHRVTDSSTYTDRLSLNDSKASSHFPRTGTWNR